MYGIFTYIWVMFRTHVGKYTIHGARGYGVYISSICPCRDRDVPPPKMIPRIPLPDQPLEAYGRDAGPWAMQGLG